MTPPSRESTLRRALPWGLVAVAIVAFGIFDVLHRAQIDPKTEDAWRERLAPVADPDLKRHHTDFTVYLAAAEAVHRGSDPYAAQSPRGWRYVYPPLLAILLQPLTAMRAPAAALLFYLLCAAALVASGIWMAKSIGAPGGTKAAGLALLLTGPFIVQTLERGQVTTLLLATQCGGLLLLLRRKDVLAGIVLALGGALRLTPLLPAAVVALAGFARWRSAGFAAVWRFPAGLATGIVLWFAVVPALVVGPSRACDVSRLWIEAGKSLYAAAPGATAEFGKEYSVDEYSYKNQGVRRVASQWLGVRRDDADDAGGGAAPSGAASANRGGPMYAADLVAWIVAGLTVLATALVGLLAMKDRASRTWRRAFALAVLAPVFATRYAWPVHYVVAVPFLAECLAGPRPAWFLPAAIVFVAGEALFYVGHLDGLHALPAYGALLVAAALSAVLYAVRLVRERARAAP